MLWVALVLAVVGVVAAWWSERPDSGGRWEREENLAHGLSALCFLGFGGIVGFKFLAAVWAAL